MNVTIVDYGMGNINSVCSALNYIGVNNINISYDFDTLKNSDKLILPGVGAFNQAMKSIKERNIDVYLKELVLNNKTPILGICLGMQLLGKSSSEGGFSEGLGFVNANVMRFKNNNLIVPHVGFNQVKINSKSKLYSGFEDDEADFYFTHSYRMMSDENINQSSCLYDEDFIASFELDNIVGSQFHPELSQHNGLKLLSNFIKKI